MFTPEQEIDLGDIEAEQFERNVHVLQDPELSAYANRVAARILTHFPQNGLNVRIFIVDLPIVDAFSLAGGRIYITRQAVALLRNEDELAGLLSHEMGHALTHQQAIDMTRLFSEVLGVTSLKDKQDLFSDFNRFLDNAARHPDLLQRAEKEEEPHQYAADNVALYAMSQAGYSPQSFLDFFNRLAETQGKTGNWLSDFLRTTKPNEKRLRELRKSLDALPPSCRGAAAPPSDAFLRWKARVIAFAEIGREESLRGVLLRQNLEMPLRTDLIRLRFSPDGRELLAQDESSIFLYDTNPLQIRIRIDARGAEPASFTPDSQYVVFDTSSRRVEKWSVPDLRRVDVHQLAVPGGCIQTLLSGDGNILACLDARLGLSLWDVNADTAIFQKKSYFLPDNLGSFEAWALAVIDAEAELNGGHVVHMAFSPDARYFLAGLLRKTMMIDLSKRMIVPLRGQLPFVIAGPFTFLTPDKIAGPNLGLRSDSGIFDFPSGRLAQRFPFGEENLEAPSHRTNTVIIRPVKDNAAGIVDLPDRKVLATVKFSPAIDVYDQTVAAQRSSGDVALYSLTSGKPLAETTLPLSPLGNLRTWAFSPDLRYLAVSGGSRGAVWDVLNSKRLYLVRGFRGAYFDQANVYVDFPKFEKQERTIQRLDLQHPNISSNIPLADEVAHQYGPYLAVWLPQKKGGPLFQNARIEVHDVRDNRLLWSRVFAKAVPKVVFGSWGRAALLEWPAGESEAQNEIRTEAALTVQFRAIRDPKLAVLLEILDGQTGKTIGHSLVDTGKGSFLVRWTNVFGDWILVGDNENRIHVYSLSTGRENGVVFGSTANVSVPAGILVVQNEPGQLDLYRLPNLRRLAPLVFPTRISAVSFSEDGKRLFVLTVNQTVYILDAAALDQPAASGLAQK